MSVYIRDMTHADLKALDRGHEFIHKGLRTRVVLRIVKPGGGAGMGEYPETCWVAFQSGLVLSSDPWCREGEQVTVRNPAFNDKEDVDF